jgi:PPOX class probable F420-dependent enzyme
LTDVDFTSDVGRKALERLQREELIWLTTVRRDGAPQPSLVWFVFQDDQTVLLFSQPGAAKIRAIRRNPNVSLNFNSDANGGSVVVLNGQAVLGDTSLSVEKVPAYAEKYRAGIARLGMTPEQMAVEYSQPIVITLGTLRGW